MSFNDEQLRQLESLLTHALNPDNNARRAAENQMEKLWNESREPLVAALIQLLRNSTNEQSRSLIAIILRRRLPNSEPVLFSKLPDALQAHVKTELLTAITVEASNYVRGLICDTVAELCEVLLHKDEWPQLIPFVFSLAASDKEHLRIAGVELFGRLTENCSQALVPHLKDIHGMIGKALTTDDSLPVRAQAVITCCKTVVHADIEDAKTINNFQPFLPELLKVLSNVLNAKQFGPAKKMLSAMVELCTEEAKFMRPFLDNWAKAMLAIGQTTALDDGIRQFSLETLVGLAEGAPGMLRKSESAVTSAVHLGLSLMLDVEDDPDWARNPETPELYDNSNFDHGEVSIDRIAVAIGPKICPIILPILSDFVSRPDWRFRHAGLRALSQAGEAVPLKDLPIKQICGFLTDANPRVRYGACHCLGQLASDFAPTIQQKHHALILPALLAPLGEYEYPRIQNFAAAALFNFIDKCAPENFDQHMEAVLTKLLDVLKNGANPVKAQVMTTMAAVAGASPEEFPKYYDGIVPLMKHVIVHAGGKENATLRSRAMESVTFIGMQCRDKFANDAKELMGVFIDMMRSGHIQSDDVSHQYMLQACARICSAVGKDFAPVLPLILPAVFEAALKKEDWSQQKTADEESEMTPVAVRMSNRGLSSSLEDKAVACSMLCSFVHDLKEAYFPFVTQTASIMVPLMSYMLHDDVRNYACACAPDLFDSAVKAMKAGVPNATAEYVRGIFGRIIEKMLVCFKEEPDAEIIITLVNGCKMMVELAEPALAVELIDEAALKTIGMALLNVLTKSHERIAAREKLRDEDDDFDEETYERIVEMNEGEDELALAVSECMGALIQSHRHRFISTWEMLLPELLRMLDPRSTPEARRISVFVFDDLVQYVGVPAAKYFPQYVPAMLQYSTDENVELRQGAAYGLGMCAEHCGEHFAPYAEAACKVMVDMIGKPDSKNEDNASPTDNMIACVGRIAIHQKQPGLLPMWLSMLPLTMDAVESTWCYTKLCELVEQNSTHLLGADFRNLPQVVRVLVTEFKTNRMSDELEPRVAAILKKLQTLPPQVFTALVNSLPEDLRGKLQTICTQA